MVLYEIPIPETSWIPEGNYRVGPLARLNVVDNIPTPRQQNYSLSSENFKSLKTHCYIITPA